MWHEEIFSYTFLLYVFIFIVTHLCICKFGIKTWQERVCIISMCPFQLDPPALMLAHVSINLKCEGISCETTSFVSIQTRMPSVKGMVNPSSRCCDMESQGCFTNTQRGKKTCCLESMRRAVSMTVGFFKEENKQHALFTSESFHPDPSSALIQANPPC